MTRWRAKRRFDANRRLGERADDALVAITVLKGRRDGIELDHDDDELQSKLQVGRELLESIRDAIDEDYSVDPYETAIADKVIESDPNSPTRLVSDLDETIEAIETAEETLTYNDGLDEARHWLQRISDIASRISRDSINRMRGSLANGTR